MGELGAVAVGVVAVLRLERGADTAVQIAAAPAVELAVERVAHEHVVERVGPGGRRAGDDRAEPDGLVERTGKLRGRLVEDGCQRRNGERTADHRGDSQDVTGGIVERLQPQRDGILDVRAAAAGRPVQAHRARRCRGRAAAVRRRAGA